LTALAAAVAACTPRPTDGRPNILLISIDSLRADHLGCYGAPRPTSPNLDRLAAEGARFQRALANSPWTLPSHITMMTGQEAGVHRVDATDQRALSGAAPTIAEILADRGYRTIGIGCAPYLKAKFGYAQGFDNYDDDLASPSWQKSHRAKTAAQAVDKALQATGARGGSPWFVFLHIWDVHYDFLPPAPFDKRFVDPAYHGHLRMADWEKNRSFAVGMDPADYDYALAQYDGGVAWADSELGRLFATLKKRGQWDRTAVIVTADHGEEFLDHGQKGHGHSLFDELLRVPLLVKAPGVRAGLTIDCPAGLIDLFPTLAEWAGAPAANYDGPGISLLPLLRAPGECEAERAFFAETNLSNLDKLGNYQRGRETMLEIGGWKYHRRVDPPARELLFHIAADPREQTNLAESDPARRDRLRALADEHEARNQRLQLERRLSKEQPFDMDLLEPLKQLGYIN
jgi:arylsulfatase A-like enzyme